MREAVVTERHALARKAGAAHGRPETRAADAYPVVTALLHRAAGVSLLCHDDSHRAPLRMSESLRGPQGDTELVGGRGSRGSPVHVRNGRDRYRGDDGRDGYDDDEFDQSESVAAG
jgi:hypothetical protein